MNDMTDDPVQEWINNGWACKRCGDLEMLEATDEDTIVNGPFVEGLCTHCVEDANHEGHTLRVEYPATEVHLATVTDDKRLAVKAATREIELADDAEPRLFCVTCSEARYGWSDGVEVTPEEVGFEGWWTMDIV